MFFEIIGEIKEIESIARGSSIYEIKRLRKIYGKGRWKKQKGIGVIKLSDGTISKAELHWYEAHGIGKKEIKIKYLIKD